jgi:hypothetical protein
VTPEAIPPESYLAARVALTEGLDAWRERMPGPAAMGPQTPAPVTPVYQAWRTDAVTDF